MATCIWEGCVVEVPVSRYSNGTTYQPKYCDPHRLERAREAALSRLPAKQRKIDSSGYVKVLTDDGWRLEHHVVMEQVLGRSLRPGETVIRKNADRQDNHPENLVLRSSVSIICPHCGKGLSDPIETPGAVLTGLLARQFAVDGG